MSNDSPAKRWAFTFSCAGREARLRVEAATCSIERGDRYVFRDAGGEWVAEIAVAAVIAAPRADGVTGQEAGERRERDE